MDPRLREDDEKKMDTRVREDDAVESSRHSCA